MSWISTPKLVAAVSQAGGLGILATGPLSAEQTRDSIREIRKLTDRPFGIGATLLMPGAVENAKVALAEQVPVINFSLGKGDWIVEQCHKYGGKVMATVVRYILIHDTYPTLHYTTLHYPSRTPLFSYHNIMTPLKPCFQVSEKHAKSAEAMGADALMVTGHEAAAHGGDVTSLVLVPCIADKVRIPGRYVDSNTSSVYYTSYSSSHCGKNEICL